MAASVSALAILAVFSSLSMNLMLQFGIGLRELVMVEKFSQTENAGHAEITDKKRFWKGLGILFITILFLWLIFSFVRSVLPMGLLEYMLIFPASSLLFSALEQLANRFAFIKTTQQEKIFIFENAFTGGALAGAALFITLNVAGGLAEAFVLSFGFVIGIVLAITIIGEIRRRSELEAVPRFLRGGPLALVAMGLLSLIFSSAALMFFEVLGAK